MIVLTSGVLLLVVLVPNRFWSTAAQEATPAAAPDCPATTPEENKEIVSRWFAELAGGSWEGVAALAAEDIVYHDASGEESQTDDAGEWAGNRQDVYPDLTITVEHLVAEGDKVASYVRHAGTHLGEAEEDQGGPPTGRTVEWVSMAIFRIECGKVAEIWSVADDLTRLRRLGIISDAELESVEEVATATP
jgi:steroid delta-isomerase-like uncharacterized protein